MAFIALVVIIATAAGPAIIAVAISLAIALLPTRFVDFLLFFLTCGSGCGEERGLGKVPPEDEQRWLQWLLPSKRTGNESERRERSGGKRSIRDREWRGRIG